MSVAYANDETVYDYHSTQDSIRYVEHHEDWPLYPRSVPDVWVFPRFPQVPGDAQEFEELVNRWESETRNVSSVTQIVMHPAYQRIIGMGPAALPLILDRLRLQPQHWFWALRAITGEDPVIGNHVGDVRQMTMDWLEWARGRGLIND